ncbi:MAG: hypothetical protein ABR575_11430 [Actinomycetota bacterium]
MGYLMIIVVVGMAGIARLWLLQRRQRGHLETVEGFRSSLEVLSEQSSFYYHRPRRAAGPRSLAGSAGRRPAPLDPARRAAAKRRLEARRRARSRTAR